VFTSH
jgi:hypothetical protein